MLFGFDDWTVLWFGLDWFIGFVSGLFGLFLIGLVVAWFSFGIVFGIGLLVLWFCFDLCFVFVFCLISGLDLMFLLGSLFASDGVA